MDHTFQASLTNAKECVKCKRGFRDHTSIAQCEACPKVGPCNLYCGTLMCATCEANDIEANRIATEANNTPAKQAERIEKATESIKLNKLISDSTKIDQSIQLVSDIFNAKTVALVDIMKAIDEDESIENKPFARAEYSVSRIKHLASVIFDAQKTITEAQNEQRANQVYLNQMMNQLKQEERDKLKIADINYVSTVPVVKKSKGTGTRKARTNSNIDMKEVQNWANKIGMPINVVHMRMLKFGWNAEKAARTFAADNNIPVKE